MTAPVKPAGRMRVATPNDIEDRPLLRASGVATKAFGSQVAAMSGLQPNLTKAFGPQLAAISGLQPNLTKAFGPQLAAISGLQPNLTKAFGPQLAAISGLQPNLTKAFGPQLAAISGLQPNLTKAFGPQLAAISGLQPNLTKAFGPQLAAISSWQRDLAQRIVVDFPRLDLRWIATFDRLTPSNLRKLPFRELDVVASVALDEGLPLSWIPRGEIVAALITADGPQARHRILLERLVDILDDCELALATSEHEWALQCRSAVTALRYRLVGPAQSHASNIVDSIVQTFSTARPRTLAVENARRDFAEIPFEQLTHYLTVRPLDRALIQWWPNSDEPLPAHFARHPTAHAVGHAGLFGSLNALVAVMLATSLTVQFGPREPTAITASRA